MSYTPEIQSEIDKFNQEQSRLLKERFDLESSLLELLSKPLQTTNDKEQIIDIQDKLFNILVQLDKNKRSESTAANSAVPDNVAAAVQKQESIKSILIATEKPPQGMLSVVNLTIAPADVISYMTFTQHLNPYGRKRQCDTELENLMAIINNELLNSLGDNTELKGLLEKF